MIVYNITNKIHPSIEEEWIRWQKEEHIPDVMSSQKFIEYKFYKLLEQNEDDGLTYVVQYSASSIEDYKDYITNWAPLLKEKSIKKWGNNFIAFRTVMQIVN